MPATRRKSATLTVRIAPAFKATLRAAAESERRSLANLVEVAVVEYCRSRNILETTPRKEKRKR
jgi:predicted HicB family RNase H-like nuclease